MKIYGLHAKTRSFLNTCSSKPMKIGHCRNMRGLGKSMVVFCLFKKLICSNERSTRFESLYRGQKYLEGENGKMAK